MHYVTNDKRYADYYGNDSEKVSVSKSEEVDWGKPQGDEIK